MKRKGRPGRITARPGNARPGNARPGAEPKVTGPTAVPRQTCTTDAKRGRHGPFPDHPQSAAYCAVSDSSGTRVSSASSLLVA
ncbi:hypothetical protein SAMN04488238_107151 [Roseicitreum antarcticum]|uniref:Uncharacterized protein n=1 Tax=Roseicitreum antarcticum TaxID=564137 RepID=A0A1H3AWD3_9RHOB|nr:hypothetical protein SAMN04488238_107151 [Roseicitreum antarcticum]